MKKRFSIFFCMIVLLCFCACSYHPPEGWTRRHHTYNEVNAFAKSIDPNATVSKEHTDSEDSYNGRYREWDAAINGVDCHVASVSDWVWNEGIGLVDAPRRYYRIDTDYDYTIMQSILSEHYPEWEMQQNYPEPIDEIYIKYLNNSTPKRIQVVLTLPDFRMLNDDELAQVWQTAKRINKEYEALSFDRKAFFGVPSPGVYTEGLHFEKYVKLDSYTYIDDFSEDGKQDFLQEYREDWALLDSGLPVQD